MATVPSKEIRTVLRMSVILITAYFKFRNRSTCSKGAIKRAGKVCGDSQDLKSPGCNLFAAGDAFLLLAHRPVSSANWDLEFRWCFGSDMLLTYIRNSNGLSTEPQGTPALG